MMVFLPAAAKASPMMFSFAIQPRSDGGVSGRTSGHGTMHGRVGRLLSTTGDQTPAEMGMPVREVNFADRSANSALATSNLLWASARAR